MDADNKMCGDDFKCFEFAEGAGEEQERNATLNMAKADKDAHKNVKTAIEKDQIYQCRI